MVGWAENFSATIREPRNRETKWNGVDGNATSTPDEWRHIRGGGGERRGSPNLKDSWQASRAPKVVLHGQHPISFGTSMPSLTHLLSLQIISLPALL